MKRSQLLAFCTMLACLTVLADGPKNLSVEVMIARFKPQSKDQVLQDLTLPDSTSKAIDALRASGRSVDVLYRGVRSLAFEPAAAGAKFDGTETRPVVFLGKSGAPPTATVYGLTLEVKVRAATNEAFTLGWEGSLSWSPDLLDRRASWQDSLQFLGKAANTAEAASAVAGQAGGTVKQAADIGLAVADLFRGSTDGTVYELPVLKTVGVSGSRACRNGQLVVNTTATEAGVKEPQVILFLMLPRIEP